MKKVESTVNSPIVKKEKEPLFYDPPANPQLSTIAGHLNKGENLRSISNDNTSEFVIESERKSDDP